MSVLRFDGVTFRYPASDRAALERVAFEASAGEIVWLAGRAGAGRSTLLRVAAGLAPAHTGGTLEGRVTRPADRAAIAWLGPVPALQLSQAAETLWEEVAFAPANLGWPIARLRPAVDEALARYALTPLAARSPQRLSGGELVRTLLAGLDVLAPTLWLLDDPFGPLDTAMRALVRDRLRALAASGACILLATEDDEAASIATHTLTLDAGRLSADAMVAVAAGGGCRPAAETGGGGAEGRRGGQPGGLHTEPARTTAPPPGAGSGAASVAAAGRHPPPAATPALHLEQVTFTHPGASAPVLRDVTLTLHPGDGIALRGPNGAGKTTLTRLAVGLVHPQSGRVLVAGVDTSGREPAALARHVGYAFQRVEDQLFERTVARELAFGPRQLGWDAAAVEQAVREALAVTGLEACAEVHPYDLDPPLRRRVALASAVVHRPALLLLDEPTAGGDAELRALVAALVAAARARGGAVLCVTHDEAFITLAGLRECRLEDGRLH